MQRCTRPLRELQSSINIGRLNLAQQFSTMDGWQAKQDARFDQYVQEKRRKEYDDAFDQRVERAFRAAAKCHKTEVLNSFKRRLKAKGEKYTAATTMAVQQATEERLRWLRDVWSQIDADYRSQDPARQETAAKEISEALRGDPGEYMRWVYELKREERFFGPKQKAALQSELSNAELPEVLDEEVNRYHNLKIDMSEIERNVKLKYGIAGQQHWAELQAAKDAQYAEKLDSAAKIYESLLAQSDRYDESRRNELLRSNVRRVHEAQVRFKAAMELEKEREKLMEAHEAMRKERQEEVRQQRIELLRAAAEMKAQGATSAEVTHVMRQRQLDAHARRQSEYQLKEQQVIQAKKARYVDLIDEFKASVEEREGLQLIARGASSSEPPLTPQMQPEDPNEKRMENVFGFMDDHRVDAGETRSTMMLTSVPRESAVAAHCSTQDGAAMPASQPVHRSKAELWSAIQADKYEDPSHAVHQARLDAAKNHDSVYEKFFPMSLAQGNKFSKQGMGEYAAGNAMDGQVFKMGAAISANYQWGVSGYTAQRLDGDGSKDYVFTSNWQVRDKKTGDVDWRYARKKGGAVFRGPRLYKIGAEREAKDPGEQTMDPMPYEPGKTSHQLPAASRPPRHLQMVRAPRKKDDVWRSK